jgi:predicted DNA binding CopG/RHH family protein
MKNKKNKSERIFYKVFALRLSEEELKELKQKHNESNVSWNRFIRYLLYKTKDIDFSLAKEELEEIREARQNVF